VVAGLDPGSKISVTGASATVSRHGALFLEPDQDTEARDWRAAEWDLDNSYEDDELFGDAFPCGESYGCFQGIPYARDLPRPIRQAWRERLGMTPRQFFQKLFDTEKVLPGSGELSLQTDEYDQATLGFSVSLKDPATRAVVGRMDRVLEFPEDSPPEVYHKFFDLDRSVQASGIAKDLLANSIAMYQQLGISRVTLFAALEVGGYAWAKYGFRPDGRRETRQLYRQVAERLSGLQGVPSGARTVLRRLVENEDPKGIWAISDLNGLKVRQGGREVPLGKALLLGTTWRGVLDLQDPQARARFEQYVHKTELASSQERKAQHG
jgi:hypothetical protein